jgi:hypothetical protein
MKETIYMLEILVISWLVISVPVTILFLIVFTVARRADRRLEGTDKVPYQQPSEKKIHFKKSIPSVDF